MSNDLKKTIRIRRDNAPDGASPAENGPSATAELELVSTQMLEKILFDMNDVPSEQMREIADSEEEGWLAREADGKNFEILKDDELESALRAANEDHDPLNVPDSSLEQVDSLRDTADDLCLVSTQHLRRMLDGGTDVNNPAPDEIDEEPEPDSFDPYNSS